MAEQTEQAEAIRWDEPSQLEVVELATGNTGDVIAVQKRTSDRYPYGVLFGKPLRSSCETFTLDGKDHDVRIRFIVRNKQPAEPQADWYDGDRPKDDVEGWYPVKVWAERHPALLAWFDSEWHVLENGRFRAATRLVFAVGPRIAPCPDWPPIPTKPKRLPLPEVRRGWCKEGGRDRVVVNIGGVLHIQGLPSNSASGAITDIVYADANGEPITEEGEQDGN